MSRLVVLGGKQERRGSLAELVEYLGTHKWQSHCRELVWLMTCSCLLGTRVTVNVSKRGTSNIRVLLLWSGHVEACRR